MPLVSAVCLQSVAASPCAFVERKEKTRYSLDGVAPLRQESRRSRNRPRVVARAHSDWELVVVAQELLYRLADMSLIRWLACLIRWSAIKPQGQTSSFTYFQGRLQGCLAAHPLSCLTANTVFAIKKRALQRCLAAY